MTDIAAGVPRLPITLPRVAIGCAYVSAVVSVFGIVSLVLFFTILPALGTLNDIAVIVQYTLMLPIAVYLHVTLRPHEPRRSTTAFIVGILGMLAVILLQLLLVTDVMSFGVQIGLVIAAFLVVLWWFVLVRRLSGGGDTVAEGIVLTVLAGLYFGYPFWAFSLARRIRAREERDG